MSTKEVVHEIALCASRCLLADLRNLLRLHPNVNLNYTEKLYPWSPSSHSPLHHAVTALSNYQPWQYVTVKFLLEQKADPNWQDAKRDDPVLYAANSDKIAQLLIDFKARVDVQDRGLHLTPLMMAASAERTAVVSVLLANEADPGLETFSGTTAPDFTNSQNIRQMIITYHKTKLFLLFDFVLTKDTAGIVISYVVPEL